MEMDSPELDLFSSLWSLRAPTEEDTAAAERWAAGPAAARELDRASSPAALLGGSVGGWRPAIAAAAAWGIIGSGGAWA